MLPKITLEDDVSNLGLAKKIVKFAIPICLAGFTNMIVGFIAIMMLSHLGHKFLAAAALATMTFYALITVVTCSLYSIGILVGNAAAKNQTYEVGLIVRNGIIFSLILGIPTALLIWNVGFILVLFKQSPDLINMTIGYFHYGALSLMVVLLLMPIGQFYVGIGKPIVMFAFSVIKLPFMIALSYVLIFGKFGFPEMDLAGINAASFYIQIVFCVLFYTYAYCKSESKHFELFSLKKIFDSAICKRLFKVGLPIGLQFGGEISAMAVGTYFMGYLGAEALAASQIVSQYTMMFVMVLMGLTQAVTVMTSAAHGGQKYAMVSRIKNTALVLVTVLALALIALYSLAPQFLMQFYLNVHAPQNSHIVKIAGELFVASGLLMLVDSWRDELSGSLRGLQKSSYPMVIGVLCLWLVSLPVSYLTGITFHQGPVGLRLGFGVGYVLAVIILWVQLSKMIRRNQVASEMNK